MLTLLVFVPLLVLALLIHLIVLPFRLGRRVLGRRVLGGRGRFGIGRGLLPLIAFAVLERLFSPRRRFR